MQASEIVSCQLLLEGMTLKFCAKGGEREHPKRGMATFPKAYGIYKFSKFCIRKLSYFSSLLVNLQFVKWIFIAGCFDPQQFDNTITSTFHSV